MQNLEQKIMDDMGREITNEIDFEVLASMLAELGWHRVTLTKFFSRKHNINILMWCSENIKYPFEHRGSTFLFQDKGDAINFTLRWL